MKIFLAAFAVTAIFFVLMSARILLKKGGEFRGTCASNNPMLKNELGECTVCGKTPTADCETATA